MNFDKKFKKSRIARVSHSVAKDLANFIRLQPYHDREKTEVFSFYQQIIWAILSQSF